ncbi:protein XRI1-like isoform X6 [Camellia sinensis]|nr:protein XRI1-like isoform X6 [Camellia sinensis]
MFDETTPVKACGDLAYHVADNVNMDKELQQCTEMSSQVKRRRMLQFDNEILGSPLCNEEISSVFLKSKVLLFKRSSLRSLCTSLCTIPYMGSQDSSLCWNVCSPNVGTTAAEAK